MPGLRVGYEVVVSGFNGVFLFTEIRVRTEFDFCSALRVPFGFGEVFAVYLARRCAAHVRIKEELRFKIITLVLSIFLFFITIEISIKL